LTQGLMRFAAIRVIRVFGFRQMVTALLDGGASSASPGELRDLGNVR